MTKDAEHTGASSEDCGSANETPENDPLGDLALRGTHNWADLPDEVGSLEWQQRLRQISPLAWALWENCACAAGEATQPIRRQSGAGSRQAFEHVASAPTHTPIVSSIGSCVTWESISNRADSSTSR